MDEPSIGSSSVGSTPEKCKKKKRGPMMMKSLFGTPSTKKNNRNSANNSLSSGASVPPAGPSSAALSSPPRARGWWTPPRRGKNPWTKKSPQQRGVRSRRSNDDYPSAVASNSSTVAPAAPLEAATATATARTLNAESRESSPPAFLEARRGRLPSPPPPATPAAPPPSSPTVYDADESRHKYRPHPPAPASASANGDGPSPAQESDRGRLVVAKPAHDENFVLGPPRARPMPRPAWLAVLIVGMAASAVRQRPMPWWWRRRQGTAARAEKAPTWIHEWERAYEARRIGPVTAASTPRGVAASAPDDEDEELRGVLRGWLDEVDRAVIENRMLSAPPWVRPSLLPSLPDQQFDPDASLSSSSSTDPWLQTAAVPRSTPTQSLASESDHNDNRSFFRVKRSNGRMAWQDEWDEVAKHVDDRRSTTSSRGTKNPRRRIDYTDPSLYRYPSVDQVDDGLPPPYLYPPLRPLHDLLTAWDPDQRVNRHRTDDGTPVMYEGLLHFDYNDPRQLQLAIEFRNDERPFKLVNVPELLAAQQKWTDEYLAEQFEVAARARNDPATSVTEEDGSRVPSVAFAAHESPHHHFLYYTTHRWNVTVHGVPPSRINDWNYSTFARHVRYADATDLSPHRPHFYWQVGVHRLERHQVEPPHQSFISKDLPSLSSPDATVFNFRPDQQRGIQCRFGERGVSAATHYDGGRNSVAMITGAKRYVLFPPSECNLLGIVTDKSSPLYRHTVLNWSNYKYLSLETGKANMSRAERRWLERAGQALAVETVLKAGEVLYIPSHWFHSVMSLQKSAQCNVRAGIEPRGNPWFGNRKTVKECKPFPRKMY